MVMSSGVLGAIFFNLQKTDQVRCIKNTSLSSKILSYAASEVVVVSTFDLKHESLL